MVARGPRPWSREWATVNLPSICCERGWRTSKGWFTWHASLASLLHLMTDLKTRKTTCGKHDKAKIRGKNEWQDDNNMMFFVRFLEACCWDYHASEKFELLDLPFFSCFGDVGIFKKVGIPKKIIKLMVNVHVWLKQIRDFFGPLNPPQDSVNVALLEILNITHGCWYSYVHQFICIKPW